jgi:hypothetical protein
MPKPRTIPTPPADPTVRRVPECVVRIVKPIPRLDEAAIVSLAGQMGFALTRAESKQLSDLQSTWGELAAQIESSTEGKAKSAWLKHQQETIAAALKREPFAAQSLEKFKADFAIRMTAYKRAADHIARQAQPIALAIWTRFAGRLVDYAGEAGKREKGLFPDGSPTQKICAEQAEAVANLVTNRIGTGTNWSASPLRQIFPLSLN